MTSGAEPRNGNNPYLTFAGLMMNGEFPINYFSISTIEQYFDDFSQAYLDTGKLLGGDEKFWRFNRIHNYGEAANKTAKQLADARALL